MEDIRFRHQERTETAKVLEHSQTRLGQCTPHRKDAQLGQYTQLIERGKEEEEEERKGRGRKRRKRQCTAARGAGPTGLSLHQGQNSGNLLTSSAGLIQRDAHFPGIS